MATPTEHQRIVREVRAELTGPGGPFELEIAPVRGRNSPVFAQRHRSLGDLVDAGRERFADREFLILDDMRLTYEQFATRVDAVAAGLAGTYQLSPGDRLAIFAANRPEWVVSFFAAARLGLIVAAINGWSTTDEARYALDHTRPALIVGDAARLERLDDPAGTTPIVDFDGGDFAALWGHDSLPSTAGVDGVAEDDPALILFTSGTTGRPKGALVSHRGLLAFVQTTLAGATERAMVARRLGHDLPARPTDQNITLGTSPLFHVSGLHGATLMNLATGGKIVYRKGRFDPAAVLALIEAERVTQFSPIGSMGARLIDHEHFARYDTSSVRGLGFGGAPLSPTLLERLRAAFPNAAMTAGGGYGSSESTSVVTSIGGPEYFERPDSAGRVAIAMELEIRDADGQAVPDGVEGEIHCRSAATMLGYWDDPEATAATIDADGWLNMGDIGHRRDGFLYINSRARDMILRAAENIYPIEIEHRLAAHPAVAEAAVVGVDHDQLGQEVKAVIVPAAPVTVDELAQWCGVTLAAHKVPSQWDLRAEPLPRNASGKVLKRDLR